MIKMTVIGGALAATLALTPASANAQSGPSYNDATAPLIVGLLQSRGMPASISYSKSTGNPYVRSRSGGFNFAIFFFSCTKVRPRRCKGVQFYSGYKKRSPLTLSLMNTWNRKKRYARGYLVADNTGQLTRARVEMDLSFSGGMTRRIFMAHLNLFQRLNTSFRAHIRFGKKAPDRSTGQGQGQGQGQGKRKGSGDHSRGIESLQD